MVRGSRRIHSPRRPHHVGLRPLAGDPLQVQARRQVALVVAGLQTRAVSSPLPPECKTSSPLTYIVHFGILSSDPPTGAQMKTEVSTVTTKGQLVIPSKLRRKYSIKKGTKVAFVEEENRLILQPLTPEFIRSLPGCLGKDSKALQVLLA